MPHPASPPRLKRARSAQRLLLTLQRLPATLAAVGLLVLASATTPGRAALPVAVGGQPLPSLAPVLGRVTPAVVNISASTDAAASSGGRASTPGSLRQNVGSGVIVDATQGNILTNHHVVRGASAIRVSLQDGRSFNATVVGSDPDTDLAVLRIAAQNLQALTLSDSSDLRVGDFVVAIGDPYGLGQSASSGIVSALDRSSLRAAGYQNFIQTDASINPGNSGGALVDVNGNLVGINTAIYSRSGGSMGIGFAIPIALAKNVLDSIVRDGKVTRGWIGVEPNDLTPELADTFGVKADTGVIITGVLQSGPAANAGIRPGDVITQIGAMPVHHVQSLLTAVAALVPGTTSEVQLRRGDQSLTLPITPGTRPVNNRAMPQGRR